MNNKTIIDISSSTIFRFIFIILVLFFLYAILDVIAILLFAIIIASAVTPFANWLDKIGFPRLLGVLVLYLAIFSLFVFLISLIAPFISEEVGQLSQTLPRLIAKLSASLQNIQDAGSRYFDFLNQFQGLLDSASEFLQRSSQSAFGFFAGVFGGVVSFVAIIIISFYLSVMRNGVKHFIHAVTPTDYEDYVVDLWDRAQSKLGHWLQSQILLALIVGLMTYVGLSLLHVRFALVLAVVAMFLELIPNVGPVLAAIPAVVLAFIQAPSLGFWVVIMYVVIQQLENHILTPLIMGKTLGINPVVVIISLLIGFKLAGIVGMLLAVPVAAVLAEFFDDLVAKKEKSNGGQRTKTVVYSEQL